MTKKEFIKITFWFRYDYWLAIKKLLSNSYLNKNKQCYLPSIEIDYTFSFSYLILYYICILIFTREFSPSNRVHLSAWQSYFALKTRTKSPQEIEWNGAEGFWGLVQFQEKLQAL